MQVYDQTTIVPRVKIFANHNTAEGLENEINMFLKTPNTVMQEIRYSNYAVNHPEMMPGSEIFSALLYYTIRVPAKDILPMD